MKHLIFAFSLLALVSCKDGKSEDTKTEAEEHTTEAHNDHHKHEVSGVYANEWINEIKKDNDGKWQADLTTNEGVIKLQNTINSKSPSTLDDYHKLAN